MTTTWKILIDWDRDVEFTDPIDDVTSYTMSANWFLGCRRPYSDVADDSMFELILDNSDQRFSPEYSGSPLYGKLAPFCPVLVQSVDSAVTRTHWVGWIEKIEPDVNIRGKRTAKITAAGPMLFFENAETRLELDVNLRSDEIIKALVQEVVYPPSSKVVWVLEIPGRSELEVSARLQEADFFEEMFSEIQTGIATFAVAGDNWVYQGGPKDRKKRIFDVYRAIRDITAAERGRFFFTRDGKAAFWNRHNLIKPTESVAEFDNSMVELQYVYAGLDELKNEITVECHPRLVSDTNTDVLWELKYPLTIPAGKKRRLDVYYSDPDGTRVGGRDLSLSDVVFSKGSADLLLRPGGGSSIIRITNKTISDAELSSCVVRGQKITDLGEEAATEENDESIGRYGRRSMKLNLPAIDNLDDAQAIAVFELDRRSAPRGSITSLTVRSHGVNDTAHHQEQLSLIIGDRVTISESQSAHDSDYFIIGEAHHLLAGMSLYETTWYLEPAPETFPWTLGDSLHSELEISTIISY
jgi:hypothetical protein